MGAHYISPFTPEPTSFNGEDTQPMGSVEDEQKERDWADLEAQARDFARQYGVSTLLRCISYACDGQRELFTS